MNLSMRAILSFSWTFLSFATLLAMGVSKTPLFQNSSQLHIQRASLLSYEVYPGSEKERMCVAKDSSLP